MQAMTGELQLRAQMSGLAVQPWECRPPTHETLFNGAFILDSCQLLAADAVV